jgi:hypothetical protein
MTILLGPVLTGSPTYKVTERDGKKRTLYKKQILPEGKYNYNGTELDLTGPVLDLAVEAFKDNAYDEVPFQFGGTQSEHNTDPFRRGGTLVHMERVPGKGIDGYFDLGAEGGKYVTDFPKFGVSPRIKLNHERMVDKKKFPVAIQHICGTLVPRVNGMSPWSKVDLSDSDTDSGEQVIDLSTETIAAPQGGIAGDLIVVKQPSSDGGKEGEDGGDMPTLSKEQLEFLNKMIEDQAAIDKLVSGTNGSAVSVNTPAEVVVPEEIKLSLGAHASEIAALKAQNVKSEWAARRAQLAAAGVPPAQLDLAEPIMTRADTTIIDLSTSEGTVQVTDKAQMLGLLESLKGTIDFGGELGHGVGGREPSADSDSQEDIDAWLAANGL